MKKKITSLPNYKERAAKAIHTKYLNSLKKRNEWFSSLSKADKRVEIAKDILIQLDKENYEAHSGIYVYISNFDIDNKKNLLAFEDDIQANFDKMNTCEVCAIGACIMSIARLGNSLTFGDVIDIDIENDNDNVENKIKSIFSPKQMSLIEAYFEGRHSDFMFTGSMNIGVELDNIDLGKAATFSDKYPNDSERLRLIFQNIIDNNGTFKPKF